MKKLSQIILIILLAFTYIFSAQQKCDTLAGNTYHYTYIDTAAPLSIHIVEVDLTNPNIEIVSRIAHSKIFCRQTTSQMAQELSKQQNVLAATNADFFKKNGRPVGAQVIQGQLVKRPFPRSVFGITKSGHPFIDIVDFKGNIFLNNNEIEINRINLAQKDDQLILYNRFRSDSVQDLDFDCQVAARYINAPAINDTALLVIRDKWNTDSLAESIPSNEILLSARNTGADLLKQNVTVEDTIKMLLSLPPIKNKIQELVGGTPSIINSGEVQIDYEKEDIPESFSITRHPRTAIGFNQEGTKLFLFTVDGRQEGHSRGMSLPELANFMLKWGVYEGVNLDGGGSTTMFVNDRIINSPSDSTGERPVANALLILHNNRN